MISNNLGEIGLVEEFLSAMNIDMFMSIEGRTVPADSFLAAIEDEFVSLKFGEPVFPINILEFNSKEFMDCDQSLIKFMKLHQEASWTTFNKTSTASASLGILSKSSNNWWEYCISQYDTKTKSFNWPLNMFHKQGYDEENFDYLPDNSIIMWDGEYESWYCSADGYTDGAFRYWLHKYSFSCYEEALNYVEDFLLSDSPYDEYLIRYSGTGNWKEWRKPSDYKKDLSPSWFSSNPSYKYEGVWDQDPQKATTKTKPRLNEIIVSIAADI